MVEGRQKTSLVPPFWRWLCRLALLHRRHLAKCCNDAGQFLRKVNHKISATGCPRTPPPQTRAAASTLLPSGESARSLKKFVLLGTALSCATLTLVGARVLAA